MDYLFIIPASKQIQAQAEIPGGVWTRAVEKVYNKELYGYCSTWNNQAVALKVESLGGEVFVLDAENTFSNIFSSHVPKLQFSEEVLT